MQVEADSKEAKRAAQKSAAASTGLDAFLQQIESKKKVSGSACMQQGYRLTAVLHRLAAGWPSVQAKGLTGQVALPSY